MIASILCALFAYCASPEPAPATAGTTEVQTLAVAVPFVIQWEGMPCEGNRCAAYLDRIASPPVWTICAGETEGVRAGEVRTRAQCEAGLRAGLVRYRNGLHRCFTPETINTRLNPRRDTAYVSLTWNIGISGACGSTAVRRLNAGDIAGGCTALTWWNKAGQRVIRGLVNRRAAEYEMCV